MDNAEAVSVRKRAAERFADGNHLIFLERPFFFHPVLERAPVDILHGKPRALLVFACIKDGQDVLVVELGNGPFLAAEPCRSTE